MQVEANGKTFTFPEGTTNEQIGEALDFYFKENPAAPSPVPTQGISEGEQTTPERERPGLFTRLQETAKDTISKMGTHEGLQMEGNVDPEIEAKLGKAEYGNDLQSRTMEFLSEGVSGAGQMVSDVVLTGGSKLIGEENSQWVKDRVGDVMGSEPVQAVTGAINEFSEENPNLAKQLGETLNVGTALGAPGAKVSAAPAAKPVTNLLKKANRGGLNKSRKAKATEILTPDKESAAPGTLDMDARGKKTYKPTSYEQKVIDELAATPGFKPDETMVYNNAIVNRRLDELRENLDNYIVKTKKNPKYDKARLEDLFDEARAAVGDRKLLKNTNIGETAEDMINYMEGLIDGDSAMDLLTARRAFDTDVRKQLGEIVFNPDIDSAANIAMNEVRKVINQLVDESVPGKNVLKSLEKQHLLYKAQSTLRKKAWAEADTFYGKLAAKVHSATGMSLPTTPLATYATALGGASAAAGAAASFPVLTAIGGTALAGVGAMKMGQFFFTAPGRQYLIKLIDDFSKRPMLKTERAQLLALYEEISKAPPEPIEEEETPR